VAGCRAALAAHEAGQIWESPDLNETVSKIYELADLRAAADGREVTPEDFRHAATALALGRHASSKAFSNADFDKVLALLRLLADPQNLKNILAHQDGGLAGERRRHVHVITQADEFYWQRIAGDKFGHADLDRLTLAELRQLSLTIRNRRAARASATANQELAAA
jgi:hypothetical protein